MESITFVSMKAKQELKNRHTKAIESLKKVAKGKVDKNNIMQYAYVIASNLGVSYKTVLNYYNGKSKGDGFLCEAITEQFRTLQIND